jgi:ferredoxin-type protein NapH
MKFIKYLGLTLFLIGFGIFTSAIFFGNFQITHQELEAYIAEKGYKSDYLKKALSDAVVTNEQLSIFEFSSRVITAFEDSNNHHNKLIYRYNSEKNGIKKVNSFNTSFLGNHIL